MDAHPSAPMNVDECQPIVTNAAAPERPMNTPCYQLIPDATDDCKDADAQTFFRICENADCKPPATSTERQDASVECLLQ